MAETILIKVDQGDYAFVNDTRVITLSNLTFTPTQEALAYVANLTQGVEYYAPMSPFSRCSVSGNTLTLTDTSKPTLKTDDILHIQFWIQGADIIDTNGYKAIVALAPGHVSLINSTIETLDPDASFVGEWEDVTNFGVIVLSLKSNVSSVVDGLLIEFSDDGTEAGVISDDKFTIFANIKKTFSFQAATQYYRVTYTNGGTIQASFRMQVILKPYYVKPSSHRISDSISLQDDAELVTNVNKGLGDLSGAFDNVTTYRGSLNVNSAWVHRKIVNETFHKHNGSTNPSGAVSAGDISITVDDATGFSTGDEVKIVEIVEGIGIQEIGIITLTNVAGSVLTLDRPLGYDYTTAATISEVATNMAVVGTLVSPVIFEVGPPLGTIWQMTRILFNITDQTAMDDSKFGGISALTNGVSLRATTEAGRTVIFANWKSNSDMKMDMYDVDYATKAPAGYFGLTGRWTFTKSEVVAELDGDADPIQKLEVLIQDDLTDLDSFRMRGQGRVFSP